MMTVLNIHSNMVLGLAPIVAEIRHLFVNIR